ncbi:mCG147038 [Mus musculus]|nr:mCG147038 [Mus musculus]
MMANGYHLGKYLWLDNYLILYSKTNSKHSKEQKPVGSQEPPINSFCMGFYPLPFPFSVLH